MDFLFSILIFTSALIFSLFKNISILVPLVLGMISFSSVAVYRGHKLVSVIKMIICGMKKSLSLMPIFVLIGIITAVWRASGTIPFLVYYGTKLMNPDYFILFAFLLSCIVSFALGTSFGTIGTIGVVLIVLAKSGDVNTNAAAGAIISGSFFGDRCSPTSSSANMIAAITETNLHDNIKRMFVTGAIPFAATLIIYVILSKNNSAKILNTALLSSVENNFNLSYITVFPALLIFILTFFKKNVIFSMFFSAIVATFTCLFVQNMDLIIVIKSAVFGFTLNNSSPLSNIISGGGLISMLGVSLIVLIASSYSGIFEGTGMLNDIKNLLKGMSNRIGIYPTTLFTSLVTGAFCCNQTLPVLLTQQLMSTIYYEKNLSNIDMAIDLENTAILTSEFFPWSVAIAIPLATLDVNSSSILFAVYLYLVPLINIVRLPSLESAVKSM